MKKGPELCYTPPPLLGDPRWKLSGFRQDVVEALVARTAQRDDRIAGILTFGSATCHHLWGTSCFVPIIPYYPLFVYIIVIEYLRM